MEAFAEHGYRGTSTRSIAAAAGLSPAALYIHFPSKEALLYEIMMDAHEDLLERMRAAIDGLESASDRLAALIQTHVIYHAHERTAGRVTDEALHSLRPEWWREVVALRDQIEAMFDDAIELGIKRKEFDVPDKRCTRFMAVSLGHDVGSWFVEGGRLTAEEVGRYYADMMLVGVNRR